MTVVTVVGFYPIDIEASIPTVTCKFITVVHSGDFTILLINKRDSLLWLIAHPRSFSTHRDT